ncbi:MAG: valine--pyruvate transaminase [Cyanobacteria bacterium P01_A01_bin.105]
MTPTLTQFGKQMSHLTGVRAIMQDIIETLRSGDRSFINLSAGNPVILPAVEQLWRDCTLALMAGSEYGEVVCRYGASQGYEPLIEAVRDDFNRRYGLNLCDRNILITPGSQSLYFLAANAFGGYTAGGPQAGQLKPIVLPLSPDYTGYGGVSLYPEAVQAFQPEIERLPQPHRFKYRPNFDQLRITPQTGFVLFSRPCNPTGNILTDSEVQKIVDLAAVHQTPVFIDSAYAPPFPALNYIEMTPLLAYQNVVHCLSLSKAGLPGERVGIAIGDASVIQVLQAFLTNLCIHSSRYGQAIAARAIRSGALADLSATVIRPHYQGKMAALEAAFDAAMPDVPWYLHKTEGSIFAWLWLQDLPLSDQDFYQRLKQKGVIIVPGNPFFPGLPEGSWDHMGQCFRISLTAPEAEIVEAVKRIATLVDDVYANEP